MRELAVFRNGLNYSGDDVGSGLKIIGVSDFQSYMFITYDHLQRVRGFEDLSPEDLLKTDDLLFVRSNGNRELVGRVLHIRNVCERIGHSGFTIRARIFNNKLDPHFAAVYFSSSFAKEQMHRNGGGTNISNLSQDILANVLVPVPPLSEQKAIAAILSEWDRALNQTAGLIAAKERFKQGLVQQLMAGYKRGRGDGGPWRNCLLGELFTERREPGNDELPMLSVTLDTGVVRRNSLGKPVRTSLEHEQHLLVRKGDIAYNMMRMWQGASGMAMEDGVVSPAYVVCSPTKEIDSRFAHHLFRSPRMIYLFWAYSYGLTDDRRRLYYNGFAQVPVTLPGIKEQKRIAALIDCLDLERSQLIRQKSMMMLQKRALMQQLLTGNVRVSEALIRKVTDD